MTEQLLIGLAAIIILGILGQWISWYIRVPSILLLLILGFIIGPVTGLLNPDDFFGELLFPFVSIAVAIILFEGGLSLKLNEQNDEKRCNLHCYLGLGKVHTVKENIGEASGYLKKALKIAELLKAKPIIYEIYSLLALNAEKKNDSDSIPNSYH